MESSSSIQNLLIPDAGNRDSRAGNKRKYSNESFDGKAPTLGRGKKPRTIPRENPTDIFHYWDRIQRVDDLLLNEDKLSSDQRWSLLRIATSRKMYEAKRVEFMFYEVTEKDKFEFGKNWNAALKRDLEYRKGVQRYERFVNKGYRVPQLKFLQTRICVALSETYNPFKEIPRDEFAPWSSEIQREIISKVYQEQFLVNRATIIPVVPLPDENGNFIHTREILNHHRVDIEIAYNVNARDVCACITGLEHANRVKNVTVAVFGGMGSGKSAILLMLEDFWHQRTYLYSFANENRIVSRNGDESDCTPIKSWDEIDIDALERGWAFPFWPIVLEFDEVQFAPVTGFREFHSKTRVRNIKLFLSGISYDLNNEKWPFVKFIESFEMRHVYQITGECGVCLEKTCDLSAQLRSNPKTFPLRDMSEKKQWITTCRDCAFRYFNYCTIEKSESDNCVSSSPDTSTTSPVLTTPATSSNSSVMMSPPLMNNLDGPNGCR